jgi:hypothetical protein
MRAITIALALAVGVLPASAQTRLCVDLATFVDQQTHAGGTVHPLSAPDEQVAVQLYNMTPPVSNETFNTVVVLERADRSAQFWYGNDGTVCSSLTYEPAAWAKMREAFIGRAI